MVEFIKTPNVKYYGMWINERKRRLRGGYKKRGIK